VSDGLGGGQLYFYESKDERRKIIVQVKGGGVKRGDVTTLLGDVNNQKAAGGILLTLDLHHSKPLGGRSGCASRLPPRKHFCSPLRSVRFILFRAVKGHRIFNA
jgi:hypothetical protein